MSSFDLDKILAAIEGDMDQEARDRVKVTLMSAIEATETEAKERARKAGEEALERHKEALSALDDRDGSKNRRSALSGPVCGAGRAETA